MNRFLEWNPTTLAQLAQDLWNQNQALRRALQQCTCGAAPSTPQIPGDHAPTAEANSE